MRFKVFQVLTENTLGLQIVINVMKEKTITPKDIINLMKDQIVFFLL